MNSLFLPLLQAQGGDPAHQLAEAPSPGSRLRQEEHHPAGEEGAFPAEADPEVWPLTQFFSVSFS